MNNLNQIRIAWLLPVAWFYWQPTLSEFTKIFPQTKIFTGLWPGFAKGFEDSLTVEEVGEMKYIRLTSRRNFTYLSPNIVSKLLQFKPQVIFADSFRLWTLFVLLLKPLFKWKIIIAYEGSTPRADRRNSTLHLYLRRLMVKGSDAFISNTEAGKNYLTEILEVPSNKISVQPYEIPAIQTLLAQPREVEIKPFELQQPVFIFIGHVVYRKGLNYLLEACNILKQKGYQNYTLLVIGDGEQRSEWETYCQENDLEAQVIWIGRVNYDYVGDYLRLADVFVLPTLEDTWAVVVSEAMLASKAVLCSQQAGASELVINGENGYVFDPLQPEKLAQLMSQFIDNPHLSQKMGIQSQQLMQSYTPEIASQSLAQIVEVLQQ